MVLAAAPAANAGLVGVELEGSLFFEGVDPAVDYAFDPNPFRVDAGIETTLRLDEIGQFLSFDFDHNSVTVNESFDAAVAAGFDKFPRLITFTDINDTLPDFNGFTLVSKSGFDGLTQAAFAFTANSITFDFGGTRVELGDAFSANISVVPLPGALPLLLCGVGALGYLRRHSRKRAA